MDTRIPSPLSSIVPLVDVAADLEVDPAAVFQAARRVSVPTPRVGNGRVVERQHIAAIRDEITRHLLVKRRVARPGSDA